MRRGEDEDREALAGEYVLGVLSAEQAVRVELAMAEDRALARAVKAWERRLGGLTGVAGPVEPSDLLWPRIAAHLDGPSRRGSAPPRALAAVQGWWESAGFWRAATALTAALAIVLGSLLAMRPATEPPKLVAVLQVPKEGRPGYVVELNADGSLNLIALVRRELEPGRALQFWTLADPAAGPVSLGLVAPGTTIHIPASQLPAIRPDQLFELTLEPGAGSPTGRPTGPIQFVGRTAARL